MSVKLLTGHDLGFLSLQGGCTGSSESTLVKMPHCWKSHVTAYLCVSSFVYHVGIGTNVAAIVRIMFTVVALGPVTC